MKKIFLFFLIVHCTLVINNCMCQWVQMSNGIPTVGNAMTMASIGNTIFAGYGNYGLGIYKTTNNGLSWNQTALIYRFVNSLFADGNYLYAGTDSGIFVTSNNGVSWTHSSINGIPVLDVTANGNTIFAGTYNYGVYISTNNGTNWTQTSLNNRYVSSLAVFNNMVFAGTTGGIYVSTNNGINWTSIPSTFGTVLSFAIIGNTIFGGIENYPQGMGGIKMSTNYGATWSYTSFQEETVFALTAYGNKLFAGTSISGIFYSSNYGINWLVINQGLPITTVRDILIANNYIFAATASTSIWRRPLSEVIDIRNLSTEIPPDYSLAQNYPNPFNPITNIRYQITNSKEKITNISLIVYNILGKEITTLVNEKQSPGVYEVTFDGSQYPSGVYFYTLETQSYKETKKMLLIK